MLDKVILGEKLETSQIFTEKGKRLAITKIHLGTDKSGLKVGDLVSVSGVSKGRGFTGVMKRWGFKGGPRTHGQSDRQRAPGSIGQTTDPGRVWKGKKMPGRSGSQKITVKNLKVIVLDEKEKLLIVGGLVTGHKKGKLRIKKWQK